MVAVSFAYTASLQEVFDALYMIFFERPFSVGDFIAVESECFALALRC